MSVPYSDDVDGLCVNRFNDVVLPFCRDSDLDAKLSVTAIGVVLNEFTKSRIEYGSLKSIRISPYFELRILQMAEMADVNDSGFFLCPNCS